MPRKSRADRKLQASEFRRRLLRWFRRHGRDLPWRRTRDPYRIVVSEFMLQQTQVARVEAYYHRFLERYPSIETLAAAPAAMVRESWEGLGYYRRAANLHRLAQAVVAEHGGRVPDDLEALVRLPGVGRYTAGAVACFAYERPTRGRGYQRRPGDPACVPSQAAGRDGGPPGLGDRRGTRPPPSWKCLGFQPGDHGAGRAGVHGQSRPVRELPGQRLV